MLTEFSDYLRYELNRGTLTVEAYLRDIRQFATFMERRHEAGGEELLAKASTADIRAWIGVLAEQGEKPRSVRRKVQSLRALFRYLLKRKEIVANPAADIVMAKPDKPLPKFVRESEMEEVLSREVDEGFYPFRDRLILELLYTTGMRRAEIIGLRDADVDLSAMQLKVTGKRMKQRLIPFPRQMAATLREYLGRREAEEKEAEGPGRGAGLLFTHKGKAMSTTRLTEIVREGLEGTSAARKSPHVLRHTFATTLLNNGAELNSVKELLGHSSVATTQIYTHLSFNELRANYMHAHPRERGREGDSAGQKDAPPDGRGEIKN
ncbi:MAG: tyrosine-type recombinase/integrase [Muribaculaceae bacterium]|nr:tyrosine-type recombinase/integrase [Muribaculaceae bacterium]